MCVCISNQRFVFVFSYILDRMLHCDDQWSRTFSFPCHVTKPNTIYITYIAVQLRLNKNLFFLGAAKMGIGEPQDVAAGLLLV